MSFNPWPHQNSNNSYNYQPNSGAPQWQAQHEKQTHPQQAPYQSPANGYNNQQNNWDQSWNWGEDEFAQGSSSQQGTVSDENAWDNGWTSEGWNNPQSFVPTSSVTTVSQPAFTPQYSYQQSSHVNSHFTSTAPYYSSQEHGHQQNQYSGNGMHNYNASQAENNQQHQQPYGYQQPQPHAPDSNLMHSFYGNNDGNNFQDVSLSEDKGNNESIPASNSFSKLQHEPSPFDNLRSDNTQERSPHPSHFNPHLHESGNTHSRQGSHGNVHFIVGSENNSARESPSQHADNSGSNIQSLVGNRDNTNEHGLGVGSVQSANPDMQSSIETAPPVESSSQISSLKLSHAEEVVLPHREPSPAPRAPSVQSSTSGEVAQITGSFLQDSGSGFTGLPNVLNVHADQHHYMDQSAATPGSATSMTGVAPPPLTTPLVVSSAPPSAPPTIGAPPPPSNVATGAANPFRRDNKKSPYAQVSRASTFGADSSNRASPFSAQPIKSAEPGMGVSNATHVEQARTQPSPVSPNIPSAAAQYSGHAAGNMAAPGSLAPSAPVTSQAGSTMNYFRPTPPPATQRLHTGSAVGSAQASSGDAVARSAVSSGTVDAARPNSAFRSTSPSDPHTLNPPQPGLPQRQQQPKVVPGQPKADYTDAVATSMPFAQLEQESSHSQPNSASQVQPPVSHAPAQPTGAQSLPLVQGNQAASHDLQTPDDFKTSAFYQQQQKQKQRESMFSPPATLWANPEPPPVQFAPVLPTGSHAERAMNVGSPVVHGQSGVPVNATTPVSLSATPGQMSPEQSNMPVTVMSSQTQPVMNPVPSYSQQPATSTEPQSTQPQFSPDQARGKTPPPLTSQPVTNQAAVNQSVPSQATVSQPTSQGVTSTTLASAPATFASANVNAGVPVSQHHMTRDVTHDPANGSATQAGPTGAFSAAQTKTSTISSSHPVAANIPIGQEREPFIGGAVNNPSRSPQGQAPENAMATGQYFQATTPEAAVQNAPNAEEIQAHYVHTPASNAYAPTPNSQHNQQSTNPAQQSLSAFQQQFNPIQQPVSPGQQPINPGRQQFNPNQLSGSSVQQPVNPAQPQCNPAQQQINHAEQQLNATQGNPAQQHLSPAGQQQFNPAQQPVDPARQQFTPAQQQANPDQQQFNPAQQQVNPGQQQFNSAQQQANPGQQQVNPGQQTQSTANQGPAPVKIIQPQSTFQNPHGQSLSYAGNPGNNQELHTGGFQQGTPSNQQPAPAVNTGGSGVTNAHTEGANTQLTNPLTQRNIAQQPSAVRNPENPPQSDSSRKMSRRDSHDSLIDEIAPTLNPNPDLRPQETKPSNPDTSRDGGITDRPSGHYDDRGGRGGRRDDNGRNPRDNLGDDRRNYDSQRSRDYGNGDRHRDDRSEGGYDRSRDSRDDYYSSGEWRYDPYTDPYRDPRYDQNCDPRYPPRPSTHEDAYGRPRSRQGYEPDRPHSRQGYPDRPNSRQGYPDDAGRSRSRQGYPDETGRSRSRQGYPQDDPRYRDPYSSSGYGGYPPRPHSHSGGYEEDYYRPRSTPTSRGPPEDPRSTSRPSSRQGYPSDADPSSERPRSRQQAEYDYERRRQYEAYRHDPRYRDYYAYGDRDYDYDYYSQRRDMRYAHGYEAEMRQYAGYEGYGYDPYSSYYGRTQSYDSSAAYDDRHSQHSASRGTTPSLDQSAADQFAREFHQGSRPSSRQGYEQSPIYRAQDASHGYYLQSYAGGPAPEGSYVDYSAYGQPQPQLEPEPARRTPLKHHYVHTKGTLSASGHLVAMLPNQPADGQPATVQLTPLVDILEATTDPKWEQLHAFPGPLVKGETHKNDVLQLCQQRARSCREDLGLVDRENAVLLWRYLELLIKQNGTAVATDVAELLMDGHEQSAMNLPMAGVIDDPRLTQAFLQQQEGGEAGAEELRDTLNRSVINSAPTQTALDRFRQLCIFGRKKEALEFAMKSNLWAQALFLAMRMGPRIAGSVTTRFMNSAMSVSDPLRTMYQLMSGWQPAACTMVADQRFGDWRPHLAIILSHPSERPELDRKAIIAMGDSFAGKGHLFASQFCYLLARCPFQEYDKKTAKLVLLGSSHCSSWEEFLTPTAVQCTEVYEYATSLGPEPAHLPAFTLYKFLYTVQLVDAGLLEEALHYCEALCNTVCAYPAAYSATFVQLLAGLADRLKYHDPQYRHLAEISEPQWMVNIHHVLQAFQSGQLQHVTPVSQASSTRASSEVAEITQGVSALTQGLQDLNLSRYTQQSTTVPQTGPHEASVFSGAVNTGLSTHASSAATYDSGVFTAQPQVVDPGAQEVTTQVTTDAQQAGQGQAQVMEQQPQQEQPAPIIQNGWQWHPAQAQWVWVGEQPGSIPHDTVKQHDIAQQYDTAQPHGTTQPHDTLLHDAGQPQQEVSQPGAKQHQTEGGYLSYGTHHDAEPVPDPGLSRSRASTIDDVDFYGGATQHPEQSDSESAESDDDSSDDDDDEDESSDSGQESPNQSPQPIAHAQPTSNMAPSRPSGTYSAFNYQTGKSSNLSGHAFGPRVRTTSNSSTGSQGSLTHAPPPPHSLTHAPPPTDSYYTHQPPRPLSNIQEQPWSRKNSEGGASLSPGSGQSNCSTPKAMPSGGGEGSYFQFGLPPAMSPAYRAAEPSVPLGGSSSTPGGDAAEADTSATEGGQKKKQYWPGDEDEDMAKIGGAGKSDAKKKDKKAPGDQKGIMGRIFGWGSKNKNEIKLPDDKKPSIVWDDDRKEWIDTTKSAEELEQSNAPPPKDSDLTGDSSALSPPGASSVDGPSPGPPGMTSSPSANRFSLQNKGRGARAQYVDVFGAKAKPAPAAPTNLFSVLPKSQSVPANIFIPAVARDPLQSKDQEQVDRALHANKDPDIRPQHQPNSHTEPDSQPHSHPNSHGYGQNDQQAYNQQQYGGQEGELSRWSSQSSLASEVQYYMQPQQGHPEHQQGGVTHPGYPPISSGHQQYAPHTHHYNQAPPVNQQPYGAPQSHAPGNAPMHGHAPPPGNAPMQSHAPPPGNAPMQFFNPATFGGAPQNHGGPGAGGPGLNRYGSKRPTYPR